jgi:hypothetical protein
MKSRTVTPNFAPADAPMSSRFHFCVAVGAPLSDHVKPMRHVLQLAVLLTILACARTAPSADTNLTAVPKVAITSLLARKKEFKGRRVEVTGYYLSYFECSKLSQHKGDGDRTSLWIHTWRVKPGHKDKIKLVEKGNVRVVGTFDYNRCS